MISFQKKIQRLFFFALNCIFISQCSFAQAAELNDWLKLSPENNYAWKIEPDLDTHLSAKIHYINELGVDKPKRVMIIYPRASTAYDTALNQLLKVFTEHGMQADFRVINFENNPILGLKAVDAVKKGDFDLIFSMGSESTEFMLKNLINSKIPVVSVCSKDPVIMKQMSSYDKGSGTNFAFTSLNMQSDTQLSYLKLLNPNLKNIGILVDSKNKSAVQTQAEPISKAAKIERVRPIMIEITDSALAVEQLQKNIPRAIEEMKKSDPELKNSIFLITGSTTVFKEINAINKLARKIPVVSVVPEVVQAGDDSAVVSIGIGFDSNAHMAALYGLDILKGKSKPGDLRVGIVTPPDIAINFRRAKEIGLKIPFSFFERASYIYDADGQAARLKGVNIRKRER